MGFPCTLSGIFTAYIGTVFVDVPINIFNLQSIPTAGEMLIPQFETVCASIQRNNDENAMKQCVNDFLWQVESWIEWQCVDIVTELELEYVNISDDNKSFLQHQSLLRFKRMVSSELSLSPNWTLNNVLEKYQEMFSNNRLQNETIPNRSKNGNQYMFCKGNDINGQLINVIGLSRLSKGSNRYVQYLFQDILSCLLERNADIRICVDPEHVATQCPKYLHYLHPQLSLLTPSPLLSDRITCESDCSPIPIKRYDIMHTIHISASIAQDLNSLTPSLEMKQLWKDSLRVLIHVGDESSAAGVQGSPEVVKWGELLTSLYKDIPLVLRMYPPPAQLRELSNLVIIPVGWNEEFFDRSDSNENIFERLMNQIFNHKWSTVKKHIWSHVGTRTFRYDNAVKQRAIMSSYFTHLQPYSFHNAESVMLPKHTVRQMYEDAYAVLSPHGDSIDGFRHYEALHCGAIPVVNAPVEHSDWPWFRHGIRPLGWLFPAESASLRHELMHQKHQAMKQQSKLLNLPINQSTSYDRSPSQLSLDWMKMKKTSMWHELFVQMQFIGFEEFDLRAKISTIWYMMCMQDIQERIRISLLEAEESISNVDIERSPL